MTTPTQRPGGTPLGFHGPSVPFLQQLLEEARASGTPTILRTQSVPQATAVPAASTNGSRRRSASVWVGGTSVAQEMRDKLRAADEARLRRTSISSNDSTSPPTRPVLHLQMPRYNAPSSSTTKSSAAASPNAVPNPTGGMLPRGETPSAISRDARTVRMRPTVGSLRLPTSTTVTRASSPGPDDSAPLKSPPIFSDVESDISATPSPCSPPTSALSATSTNTTLTSNAGPGTPRAPRRPSPVKRSYDGSSSPEMLSKKMRTQTLPATGRRTMAPSNVRSPGRYSIGGDSRPLMNNSAFTERPPAPPLAVGAVETGSLPKLSSLRPEAVGPQGVPVIPITPARSTTHRPSAIERDESPEPAETPIYARSLHLVDIGVSIYKKIHGDESSECPLCLYCFRQHGAFNRINEHGYEVCGSDEALDSHYWEPYGDTVDYSER